jgi:putative acetyltransferase
MLIRPETAEDYRAIRNVNLAAFASHVEATLVERLRDNKLVIPSLLAVDDAGHAVGHILFSPVTITSAASDDLQIASLAPMSVVPSHQRKGIGSSLIKHGVEACRRAHCSAIVLVGHPCYYPRFGFSHSLVAGLKNSFAADEACMGLELIPGSLSGIEGRVVYPKVFNEFS